MSVKGTEAASKVVAIRAQAEAEDAAHPVPMFSDEWLALGFAAKHAGDMRYVSAWNRWMAWDGTRWLKDTTLLGFDKARAHCREVAAVKNKVRKSLASAKTVAAVEKLAKSDRRLAADVMQWDRNPWLLGTPGGTVDLRTGETRPSDPAEHITKQTAVAPGGECPNWMATLKLVTGEDAEMMTYLQRLAGYALTGSTREEAIIFIHGDGGNGKDTFLDTLQRMMGDYAISVPMTTLVQTKHADHPTEIAKLCGARLAVANETADGSRWNTARLKQMTGGGKHTGRFMRGDYFDFEPTYTLIVAGNKKPLLGVVDDAFRRRMHFVAFGVKIKNQDKTMKEKLAEEMPGILRWAIEGAVEWRKHGLVMTAKMRTATEDYLHDQDDVQLWIESECSKKEGARTASKDLFTSWRAYAAQNGIAAGSAKAFTQLLTSRGFEVAPTRSREGTIILGLSLEKVRAATGAVVHLPEDTAAKVAAEGTPPDIMARDGLLPEGAENG